MFSIQSSSRNLITLTCIGVIYCLTMFVFEPDQYIEGVHLYQSRDTVIATFQTWDECQSDSRLQPGMGCGLEPNKWNGLYHWGIVPLFLGLMAQLGFVKPTKVEWSFLYIVLQIPLLLGITITMRGDSYAGLVGMFSFVISAMNWVLIVAWYNAARFAKNIYLHQRSAT